MYYNNPYSCCAFCGRYLGSSHVCMCHQATYSKVSSCPHCGGPIYESLRLGSSPTIFYSCDCRHKLQFLDKPVLAKKRTD